MAQPSIAKSPLEALCRPEALVVARSLSSPSEIVRILARRVIWFRQFRQLSQAQLAANAGISRSAVNDAESGLSQITIRTLYLLAVALGTNPAVLLGCLEPPAELLEEDARRRRF